jgi:hypothetical protein
VTRRFRLPEGRWVIAIITIVAITGTLSSCGRYGRPVRVAPTTPNTPTTEDTSDLASEDEHAALVDARLVNESSAESDEAIVTEETEE